MSSFHPGVFYPPSLLFILEDTTYAINLFYVLHFLILGVFTYLLTRSWGFSFVAALCSAVTGMLSGFIMASVLLSNLFISAVWLPAVFWLFHEFWTRKSYGYFIGLVVAIACQTLAACPEINIMTMLLLYAHSLYFLPRSPGLSGVGRMTVPLGLAVVLALGVSALQLVPTASLIKHSFRDGGLGYDRHTEWSMEPFKLLTFALSPDYSDYLDSKLVEAPAILKSQSQLNPDSARRLNNFRKVNPEAMTGFLHTFYMGLLGLVFVFLGFFFRREKQVGFWLLVFLIGIFLALGKNNPFYELIYAGVPFLNLFRYPEKYIYISCFAVVFLTGYGLDYLIRYTQARKIRIFQMLTVLIILFGLLGYLAVRRPHLNPEYSLAFLALFSYAYTLFYFGKMKKTWFAGLVFLIILVDLSSKGTQLLPLIDRKYYEEKPLLTNVLGDSFGKHRIYSGRLEGTPNSLDYPNGPTRFAAVLASKEHLYPYMGMVYGLEHVDGLTGLALGLKDDFLWRMVFVKSQPDRRKRILARSNVKYWIDGDQPTAYQNGYPIIFQDRLKILKDALPRAFLVPAMRVPKQEGHLLNTYYEETFNPLKEVLLSEEIDFKESSSFEGVVEQVAYRSNHVTVKTAQQGSGFLVLMDSYFPGWTVKVDGQERPVLRANHYYRAVQLDSGSHTLEFDYFPEGLNTGLMISGVSVLLIAFGNVFRRRYVKQFI
ncbi:MAG: YfhO family protein [Nitrospinota bacterium]|nr:YfhO family protein [Nitrospinota bacterium]MDH5789069.1 YfhO family protein [Nitrospinota bacterium]